MFLEWSSSNGLLTVHDIQQWCQWIFSGNCMSIEIDWKGIGHIEDIGTIAQLFSFLCEAKTHSINVTHVNNETNNQVLQIIASLYQECNLPGYFLIVSNFRSVSYKLEENIQSEKKIFIDFILQSINLSVENNFGLLNSFGELLMNICDHSEKHKSGYSCVAQVDRNTRILNIAFSDLGRGIPASLKQSLPKDTNDSDLIAKAIKKDVTCKSHNNNSGFGLDNVNSLVNSTDGHWQIYSGNGYFDSRPDAKYIPHNHIGTLVVLQIPLDNFPDLTDDLGNEYINEVEF